MAPLVSILIPAHNAEQWIEDTIRSALAQTWPNKEIIIVDDGSTDQTLSIAQQFASKTVYVISQKNQGAAAARNKAFAASRGEYIQWLDADDLLSSEKISKQMEVARAFHDKHVLLSSGWAYFMYRPARARFIPSPLWCDLSPLEWLVRKWEHNAHMQTATWLVSRELTDAAGPWNGQLLNNDDGEYFCRVLVASRAVRFVADAKVFYRAAGSSRLSYVGRSNDKIEAHLLGMRLQIGHLRNLADSDRVRAACLNHLQNCFIYFYPERRDLVEQLQELAAELGGKLEIPRFGWKYAWIEKTFGFNTAKAAQLRYNVYKASVLRAWDKFLSSLETGRLPA
jgi:Glycosyltransferases involved in cell wall biogenesis